MHTWQGHTVLSGDKFSYPQAEIAHADDKLDKKGSPPRTRTAPPGGAAAGNSSAHCYIG